MSNIDTTDALRQVEKLNVALASNRITQREYTRGMESLQSALIETGKSMASTKVEVSDLGDAMVNAFKQPVSTLKALADQAKMGFSSGRELGEIFGAIAGLFSDDEPVKEEAKLNDVLKHQNVLLREQYKIKKSMPDCSKMVECEEEKNKKIKETLKTSKLVTEETKKQIKEGKSLSSIWNNIARDFSGALDRFVELDRAAEAFRREVGLTGKEAFRLQQTALELNQQFVSLGVTIEGAYRSVSDLIQVIGTSLLVNKENAETVALLAANYGVSEKSAAGFYQKMVAVGDLTDAQTKAMAGFTANLSAAAGVNIDEVMGDVAHASADTLTMMRGNVKQMTFAAIQAKQLGVSLDKSATAAKGLLNFSQSVGDEMEASVLLGKNLNLNYARQLSFQGDVSGAQKEILNQVRSMGDFNKMNVFQQESLAKAVGYSVDELSKMVKNEEKLSQLTGEQRKSYDEALESYKEQNVETGKDLLMKAQMQGVMRQLSNVFMSFKQIAADILTPVVMAASKLLIPLLKGVLLLFNFILVPVKSFSNTLYKLWADWKMDEKLEGVNKLLDSANIYVEKMVQYLVPAAGLIIKISASLTVVKNLFAMQIDIVLRLLKPVRMLNEYLFFKGLGINSIGGSFKQVGTVIMFVTDKIEKMFMKLTQFKNFLFRSVQPIKLIIEGVFSSTGKVFETIGNLIVPIVSRVRSLFGIFGSAAGSVGKFAELFGKISRFAGLLGTAGKAIPIVGEVITALQAAWSMVKTIFSGVKDLINGNILRGLMKIFTAPMKAAGDLITDLAASVLDLIGLFVPSMKGMGDGLIKWWEGTVEKIYSMFTWDTVVEKLKSTGSVMFDVITWPFKKAIDWLSEFFTANSPSGLGLSIVKGLAAVGTMIFDVLIAPFKMIMTAIIQMVSSISTPVTQLFSSIATSIIQMGDSMLLPFEKIKTAAVGLFSSITTGFSHLFSSISTPFEKIMVTLTHLVSGIATPFEKIRMIVGGIGELLVTKFLSGLTSIGQYINGVLSAPFKLITKVVGVEPSTIKPNETKTDQTDLNNVVKAIEETNRKLDGLIKMMAAGGIAVHLDGRKVSEQLSFASY